jgi:hypothetical protein
MAQSKIVIGTATPETGEDHFIGVIPDVYRGRGLGGKEQYNIIVTGKHIIFAFIQASPGKPATTSGYAKKSTAEILAESKKNFSVERVELKTFKFTLGHSYTDCCRKLQEIDGELEFNTNKARYSFYVPFRRTQIAKDVFARAGFAISEPPKSGDETG